MATEQISTIDDIRHIAQEEIAKMEPWPQLYPMGLWELKSQTHQLKLAPIPIVVEEWPQNDFIAHWHDVGAIGFGESKETASENLAEDIIALYEDLKETTDEELGKLPLKAKKILLKTIEEIKP
jgi:hypothetical protein